MKLLWTKNDLPLSRLIRFLTDTDCSHFAVHFETLGLILQSNLIGVHLNLFSDFIDESEVVHFIPLTEITAQREASICLEMMEKIAGKSYGFRALIYFGYRSILKKFFKRKLPERNEWADKREFLCTAIYDQLPDDVIPAILRLDYAALVTPHDLYEVRRNLTQTPRST